MFRLFEHNMVAYDSAVTMLRETGKAAIIHPTGTGKSFVGFKLCYDNPDKIVCWLSPSEYIFNTQLENLAKASEGRQPDNIRFFTYARLMSMSDQELGEIRPDYIVLDEFHRAGAEFWGAGVKRLIERYSEVPLLGLSATCIRYLDNRRNMADELFDGNVASEMTLGEAIARGILAAPKYVLSVFSYQKDLEKYKRRVRAAKSVAVRDEAAKYLEALRRALAKADGLDVIFDRHMTDRNGKYIVFCAGFEHLREMIALAKGWFAKVDSEPHIYTAYSNDPRAKNEFESFKSDCSGHLKLLFCIDMLNEGVHVDDISGVVLLRPTVSPIVYKQQIGRALAAGRGGTPIIFDIVLNIESLYSIGAIEEEMQVATAYYRSLGHGDEIVSEHFKIIDEVKDCIELFEKLNETLSASWDLMYEKAREYFKLNKNLEVPRRYKTAEGYSLGNWLLTQRRVRAGEQLGRLTDEQINKLDAIGMVWGTYRDLSWERNYAAAKTYFDTYGNLNIAVSYKTPNGLQLGAWIARLRSYRKSNIQRNYLTDERIRALDAIGMVWDVPDYLWQRYYGACLDFYQKNGHLDVPLDEVTDGGIKLGVWINSIRSAHSRGEGSCGMSSEQIEALDALGMLWDKKNDRLWQKGYQAALEYRGEHGDLNVPTSYRASDGYRLGAWIADQRESKNMPARRRQMLCDIGMIWQKPDSWEVRYALAAEYYNKHGDLNIPPEYKPGGIWLAKWLSEQRQIYAGKRGEKRLTEEQIKRLDDLGICWNASADTRNRTAWEARIAEAERYFSEHGDLNVPASYVGSDGKRLGSWLKVQRKSFRDGKLSDEQIKRLSAVGMVWEFDDPWENGFLHAEAYYHKHGDLNVPSKYVCDDGFALGTWLNNQRAKHNHPSHHRTLTAQQITRLDTIGMRWHHG